MSITKTKAAIAKAINAMEDKDKLELIEKLLAHLSYDEEVEEEVEEVEEEEVDDEEVDDEEEVVDDGDDGDGDEGESWSSSTLKDMMSELESRLVDPDQIKAFFKRKKALDKAAQAKVLARLLDSIDNDYEKTTLKALLRVAKTEEIELNLGRSNAKEEAQRARALTQLVIAGAAVK